MLVDTRLANTAQHLPHAFGDEERVTVALQQQIAVEAAVTDVAEARRCPSSSDTQDPAVSSATSVVSSFIVDAGLRGSSGSHCRTTSPVSTSST